MEKVSFIAISNYYMEFKIKKHNLQEEKEKISFLYIFDKVLKIRKDIS